MLIYDSWLWARAGGGRGGSLREAGRRPSLHSLLHSEVLSLTTFASFFLIIVGGGGQTSQTKGPPLHRGNLIKRRREDRSGTKTSAGTGILTAITQTAR